MEVDQYDYSKISEFEKKQLPEGFMEMYTIYLINGSNLYQNMKHQLRLWKLEYITEQMYVVI